MDIQLKRVSGFLADRKITLEMTPASRAALAEWGYDPAYGARPLKRAIQKRVVDELAKRMLNGSISDGDGVTVDRVDDGSDGLSFSVKSPSPVAS